MSALAKVSSFPPRFPFAFQSPRSCRPSIPQNGRLLPFCANDAGKWRKPLASRDDQSKHPDEPLWLKET
jgi:hypothetical protein